MTGRVKLERKTTWEEWERGRAARRAACDRVTGGRELRRPAGDPRKDALLRAINNGERGLPFPPLAPLRP
jgi:hypothetical protein